jgi:predicted tellurium resistance membrane protein TerC
MENVIALVALTAMEIVLGIDNIVFIVILTGRLPAHQQKLGRRIGLVAAMAMRVVLLLFLNTLLTRMQDPFFYLTDLAIPESWFAGHEEINGVSVRDLILLGGGLFLLGKSVFEIHEKMEGHESKKVVQKHPSFRSVIVQIMILDIVFSLDSVITAVGMAESIWVMVTAVVIAVLVMLVFSEPISRFVESNPTLKMLALSFLILIGVVLVAEGSGVELNKGYIYFAMAFSLVVEFLNIRVRRISARRAERKAT